MSRHQGSPLPTKIAAQRGVLSYFSFFSFRFHFPFRLAFWLFSLAESSSMAVSFQMKNGFGRCQQQLLLQRQYH
jgi:hypothetical protein